MPKRESPDFRFPEVGSFVIGLLKCCSSFSNEFKIMLFFFSVVMYAL